jgi:hypothetical protein
VPEDVMTASVEVLDQYFVPALPRVIADTPAVAPIIPSRLATALRAEGVSSLGGIQGWTVDRLMRLEGAGFSSATTAVTSLRRLATFPPDRLEQLSWPTGPRSLPLLPPETIGALCYATTVEEEIEALVCDLPERNRDLVFARWGFRLDEVRTLDEIGREYGITRERARQLVAVTECQIANSGLRLPLASGAVEDLDEAGGALTDADYTLLLRYGLVSITPAAVRMLPALHEMNCVPQIAFGRDAQLWLTAVGRERLLAGGDAHRIRQAARRPKTREEQILHALFGSGP